MLIGGWGFPALLMVEPILGSLPQISEGELSPFCDQVVIIWDARWAPPCMDKISIRVKKLENHASMASPTIGLPSQYRQGVM